MSIQNLDLDYLFFIYLAVCTLATKARLFPCKVYLIFISKLSTCPKGDVIYYVVNSIMSYNCYITSPASLTEAYAAVEVF